MKWGIISDIHGNLEALRSVLEILDKECQRIICLGDIVGYGPFPNECIEELRKRDILCLMGNHDAAAVGRVDLQWFNYQAKEALLWTRQKLTAQNIEFLSSLPHRVDFMKKKLIFLHGSLREYLLEYITGGEEVFENFHALADGFSLFVGHTHYAVAFFQNKLVYFHKLTDNEYIEIGKRKAIINVGSVGQPRDNDPRASFGILDLKENILLVKKITYQVQKTQQQMYKENLPIFLIERLTYGI